MLNICVSLKLGCEYVACYATVLKVPQWPHHHFVLFFSFLFLPLLRMLVVFAFYLNSIVVVDDDYNGVDATGEDK